MNDMIPDDGGKGARRQGTLMIFVGWALAILVLTMLFGRVLENQRNPNTAKVLGGQEGRVVLQANRNGMYRAEGHINGTPVEFLLDTGATVVAVPMHIAKATGMELGSRTLVATANGTTEAWNSRIDSLELGNIVISDVAAIVLDSFDAEVLLGMSALGGLEFRHSSGTLELWPAI